jgi:hypothetical protein
MTLTAADLTALLTWHQHPKIAGMKKDAKFVAWIEIECCGKAPPAFKRWTNNDKEQLTEVQSNIVEMAHTVLGYLKELKKKELLFAVLLMTREEFDKLAAEQEKLIVESATSASNDNPLNFDTPNELIFCLTDTNNTGNDASADTSEDGGGTCWG